MNEHTLERSYIHASIVKNPLVAHQLARYTNELKQERRYMHANIVKSPFISYHNAGNTREFTQEKSHTHANIVKKNAWLTHQFADNMNELTQA